MRTDLSGEQRRQRIAFLPRVNVDILLFIDDIRWSRDRDGSEQRLGMILGRRRIGDDVTLVHELADAFTLDVRVLRAAEGARAHAARVFRHDAAHGRQDVAPFGRDRQRLDPAAALRRRLAARLTRFRSPRTCTKSIQFNLVLVISIIIIT